MGVVAVKTTSITNLDATPALRPQSWVHGGGLKTYSGYVAAADGDSIASTYRFFRVGSWMRPHALILSCAALSAGAGDIGLYKPAAEGGAVVDADFFASAQSLAAALVATDVTYESAAAATNMGLSQAEKAIWEVLGLTVDPKVQYDVAITLTTAAGAAGGIVLRGSFQQ